MIPYEMVKKSNVSGNYGSFLLFVGVSDFPSF